MRNQLPKKHLKKECGVINLGSTADPSTNSGTHWVSYFINSEGHKYYFDSFGDIQPPKEVINYLGKDNTFYNYNSFQKEGVICGHLCLAFLTYIANQN